MTGNTLLDALTRTEDGAVGRALGRTVAGMASERAPVLARQLETA